MQEGNEIFFMVLFECDFFRSFFFTLYISFTENYPILSHKKAILKDKQRTINKNT